MKGSQFLKYMNPVLHVLRENGGIGAASEMIDAVIEYLRIPEEEVEQTISSGQSRVRNQIQWARYYLAKAGLIDSPKNGIWRLTPEGIKTNLSEEEAYEVFQRVLKEYQSSKKKGKSKKASVTDQDDSLVADEEHSDDLLDTLKSLSPRAFERVCKRLLT